MATTKNKQKSADGLKGRLEDYSAAARAGATRATLRQRMGNWPIYAAATGSAVAMATGASASTIISYTGAPVTVSKPGNSSGSVGITLSNAKLTFHIKHKPNTSHAAARATAASVLISAKSIAKNLSSQAVVGAGGPWTSSSAFLRKDNNGVFLGNWAAGVPGFEGFRFSSGGHEDYGWAKVEVGVDGSGYPDSITLLAMAYDTSGASIKAGDAGTPEPATAGLMLLALGAAGVTLLRKRKRSAQ